MLNQQRVTFRQLNPLLILILVTVLSAAEKTQAAAPFQFARDCTDCHGMPPMDSPFRNLTTGSFRGNHQTHATPAQASCDRCHNGSATYSFDHMTSIIIMSGNINSSPQTALYNNTIFFNHTSNPVMGSCTTVNCHFETTTPVWGSALYSSPADCSSCHGAPPTGIGPGYAGGAAGKHAQHDGYYPGASNCSRCHPDHLTATPFSHATSAGHPGSAIAVRLAPGTYTGTGTGYLPSQAATKNFGTCTNTYCHSNGAGSPGNNTTFTWNPSSPSLLCSDCHNYTSPAMATGRHSRHVAPPYSMNCSKCHYATTTTGSSITDTTRHVNTVKDVVWDFTNTSSPAYVNATTTCTNLYCHSRGTSVTAPYATPTNTTFTWTAGTLLCNGCHGTAGTSGGNALSAPHDRHINNAAVIGTNLGCVACHAKTVSSDVSISNASRHVNKLKDYSGAKAGGSASYAGGVCSGTYCHTSGKKGTFGAVSGYTEPTAPSWTAAPLDCKGCHGGPSSTAGEPVYTGGASGSASANSHGRHVASASDCATCHNQTTGSGTAILGGSITHLNRAIDVNFHLARAGASAQWIAATRTCNSVACHANRQAQWGQAGGCGLCHPLAGLSAGHAKHIDVSSTPAFYDYTANRSTSTSHNFGCSNCHPLSNAAHTAGPVLLDLRPGVAGAGTLRGRNSAAITASGAAGTANSGTTGTPGSSVVCLNVYCHSNGYAAGPVYATTPDWYGGSFTGDRCANCHGNSPNSGIAGSPAHYNSNFLGQGNTGGHQVGIHYRRIYNRPSGLAAAGTDPSSSHGNPGTSTTISCNICHYETVTSARNDNNVACVTCHAAGNTVGALSGNAAAIADKAQHVNGRVTVTFMPAGILSRAQLRGASERMAPYSSVWTRTAGYKVAGSFDSARSPLDTATMWDSTTRTCSNISCHNGQSVKWDDVNGTTTCQSCHPAL